MNKPIIEASCEVDGVKYHAVSGRGCDGCVADTDSAADVLCGRLGPCQYTTREDRTNIVWVREE